MMSLQIVFAAEIVRLNPGFVRRLRDPSPECFVRWCLPVEGDCIGGKSRAGKRMCWNAAVPEVRAKESMSLEVSGALVGRHGLHWGMGGQNNVYANKTEAMLFGCCDPRSS